MTHPGGEQRLYGLDLVRGIAALVVLVYHSDFGFGLRGQLLPGGFLAVDLFFILSGFVLSLNYGAAIADGGVTWRRYIVARLARLYPLFVVTMLAGVPLVLARLAAAGIPETPLPVATTLFFNSLMLPDPLQSIGPTLFPFNAASWSIFFEMVMSVLFFVALARLGMAALTALTLALLVWLLVVVWSFGTLDIGYSWINVWGGFPRAGFAFCVGMIMHRLWQRRRWSVAPVWLVAMIAVALLCIQGLNHIALSWRGLVEIALVFLVFVPLAACAAGVVTLGRGTAFAGFLGDISYAVYLTQGPMILLIAGSSKVLLGRNLPALAPWSGIVLVASVVVVSYLSQRWFEAPTRRALRRLSA